MNEEGIIGGRIRARAEAKREGKKIRAGGRLKGYDHTGDCPRGRVRSKNLLGAQSVTNMKRTRTIE